MARQSKLIANTHFTHKTFPRRDDGEFAVHDAKNGLQKWDWEEEANARTSQYFKDKRDDGENHMCLG